MRKLLFILSILSLAGCGKKEIKDVEAFLAKKQNFSSFALDSINTSKWDSLYVMNPYQYAIIEKRVPHLSHSLKRKLKQIGTSDDYCALIFVRKQQVVNYSIVDRNIADFSSLDGKIGYSSKQRYRIVAYRKVCPI